MTMPPTTRAAFLLTAGLLCTTAQADTGDIRCFQSPGVGKPLRLAFGFPPEGSKTAYVRYENGSANIPLKLIKSDAVETAPGRPMEITTTWKEMMPGGGTYTVVSQGANVYGFTYIRAKDGKAYQFEQDLEAWEEGGCRWTRR